MTSRILPPAEWVRLHGTELEEVWPHLDQTRSTVIVVEDDDGAIVGCWAAFPYVHVEGLWIAPSHRKGGSVARRLWQAMCGAAERWGCEAVMTGALSDEVRALLAHAGAVSAGDQYILPLQSERPRLRKKPCLVH